tara:strand:+ start:248 stop:520 length:273 start_codon:yes stop_codon:yes gene_type:complete
MSSKLYHKPKPKPKFKLGDLVEYVPSWREEAEPPTFNHRRWIGVVIRVEVTTIQTRTAGLYQIKWCEPTKDQGWYIDGQLKLLVEQDHEE